MKAAFGFLSVLPFGGSPRRSTLAFFAVVGAVLGAVLAAVGSGISRFAGTAEVAVVMVAADLALTGMLHFDGLADCGDGLLAHLEPERRREVMKSPEVGAFGVVAVVVVVLARFVGFMELDAVSALWMVVPLWSLARLSMAVALTRGRYLTPGGIGTYFDRTTLPWWVVVALAAVTVGLTWRFGDVRGVVSLLAVVVGFGVTVAFAYRRIGGLTGDVLGAAGIVGETLGLLVGGLRW